MVRDPLAFLNGRFVRQSQLAVPAHDAGFVLAATVTDFARTYGRTLFRWGDHLARFRRDCKACFLSLPNSDAELTEAVQHLLQQNADLLAPEDEFAVVLFATPGPLGYLVGETANGPPTVGMHVFRLPVERYARFAEGGASLTVAGTQPESSVIPGGIKHRSRLHWYFAEKLATGWHPGSVAVLVDRHGASADTAIGAVLAVAGSTVYRSPVGQVQDSVSLEAAKEGCAMLGLRWEEAAFDFEGLCRPVDPVEKGRFNDRVTEVLLAGSGFGLAGVSRCATQFTSRDFPWPGPVCQDLQRIWHTLGGSSIPPNLC